MRRLICLRNLELLVQVWQCLPFDFELSPQLGRRRLRDSLKGDK